ncbi:MAG TPA: hypothetical protein VF092_24280 [Longimicrobium sp.]
MDSFSLNPADLQIESFTADPSDIASPPGGMRTYEPGCTTPDLCPIGVVVGMKTYEPGCTTPELCPNGTVAAA